MAHPWTNQSVRRVYREAGVVESFPFLPFPPCPPLLWPAQALEWCMCVLMYCYCSDYLKPFAHAYYVLIRCCLLCMCVFCLKKKLFSDPFGKGCLVTWPLFSRPDVAAELSGWRRRRRWWSTTTSSYAAATACPWVPPQFW